MAWWVCRRGMSNWVVLCAWMNLQVLEKVDEEVINSEWFWFLLRWEIYQMEMSFSQSDWVKAMILLSSFIRMRMKSVQTQTPWYPETIDRWTNGLLTPWNDKTESQQKFQFKMVNWCRFGGNLFLLYLLRLTTKEEWEKESEIKPLATLFSPWKGWRKRTRYLNRNNKLDDQRREESILVVEKGGFFSVVNLTSQSFTCLQG